MSKELLLKKFKDVLDAADKPHPRYRDRERSRFPTGILSLDIALEEIDGLPSGRIVQLVGDTGSGKSTVALNFIRARQALSPDEYQLYVDFERTFTPEYAAINGINLENLIVARPDTTEQGFDIAMTFIAEEVGKLIIIDSVPAAVPSSELGKGFSDNQKMASTAYIVGRMMRNINPFLDNNDGFLVLINQYRANMNTLSPETKKPAGGFAVEYYPSYRIDTVKIKTEDDKVIIQATTRKNKSGGSSRNRAEFFITYGTGVDHKSDILALALRYDIIAKSGSWYRYNDLKAQGVDNAGNIFPIEEIYSLVLERVKNDSTC